MPQLIPDDSTEPSQDREAVFGRLIEEHASFLYRVAYGVLRQPQDAEDAVQNALLKLYRGESWPAMRDERAFLARVVWRTALDCGAGRAIPVAEEEGAARLVDQRPSPEVMAADVDQRALLHELIDALPGELRQPLLLSAMEEMSSREIGEVMGLPEGTVRTRLMRARAQLKAAFEARQAMGREVMAGERSTR